MQCPITCLVILWIAAMPIMAAQATSSAAAPSLNGLPLLFVENQGQWDAQTRYSARESGLAIGVERDALVLQTCGGGGTGSAGTERTLVRLCFEGASPSASLSGERRIAGVNHFLLGSDPSRWRRNVPAYEQVLYRGLYDGVDVRIREEAGGLKYDVLVAAGADLGSVVVRCDGATGASIDPDGALVLQTPWGPLRQPPPVCWQETFTGERQAVTCRYRRIDAARYGFEAPDRDPGLALVIDPGLEWSTFLGGSAGDAATAVALAGDGTVIVAGAAESGFPRTPAAYDTSYAGAIDGFICCLDPSRSGSAQLVWATYLGGVGVDAVEDLALHSGDPDSVVAVGFTESADFPATPASFDPTHNGGWDGFVACLCNGGTTLRYATFLGGANRDYVASIDLGRTGTVTVAGATGSSTFPTTAGAFDRTFNGGGLDCFVTRLNRSGGALVYSTFIGGAAGEAFSWSNNWALGRYVDVAVGPGGEATLVSTSQSSNYPTTPGAYDRTFGGVYDAVITRLDPSGGSLLFSTYLGGSLEDGAMAVALGPRGESLVSGYARSTFPTTPGAYDKTYNGGTFDAFLARLSPPGDSLTYSSFLGGPDEDFAPDVAVHPLTGDVILGGTCGPGFPSTADSYDPTYNGNFDMWLARMSPDGSGAADLVYATFLGGGDVEFLADLALVEGSFSAVVAGQSASAGFPVTPGAFGPAYSGGVADAVISRIQFVEWTAVEEAVSPFERVHLGLPLPNPARDEVSYRISVARAMSVAVGVFDVGGRLVERLIDRVLEPGVHDLSWPVPAGRQRPAQGMYYLRLESAAGSESRPFILLAP